MANEILKFSTEISSYSSLNVRFLCGQCHGIFFVANFFTRSPNLIPVWANIVRPKHPK